MKLLAFFEQKRSGTEWALTCDDVDVFPTVHHSSKHSVMVEGFQLTLTFGQQE